MTAFMIQGLLSTSDEETVEFRLRCCIREHQDILRQVELIEADFTITILAQLCVSMLIICVTAYQLAFESTDLVRILSMTGYLINMIFEVFIYCNQGTELGVESADISTAAYGSAWYSTSVPLRRCVLAVMTRSQHRARVTVGGFTELSLVCFVTIVKTSYSFFTVLKNAED